MKIKIKLITLIIGAMFLSSCHVGIPSPLYYPLSKNLNDNTIKAEDEFSFESQIWQGGTIKAKGDQIVIGDKTLIVNFDLEIDDKLIEEFSTEDDKISAVLTLERFFDKNGNANAINNEHYSTVLTKSGVPIEFSESEWGASSKFNTKENEEFMTSPIDSIQSLPFDKNLHFSFDESISNLPAGIYKPRIHLFYTTKDTEKNKIANNSNALLVAHQIISPVNKDSANEQGHNLLKNKYFYLPTLSIGNIKKPQMPAVLFTNQSSKGTRGVVSNQDSKSFQISNIGSVQSALILKKGEYSLDPSFPLVAQLNRGGEKIIDRIQLKKSGFLQGEVVLPSGEKSKIPRAKIKDFYVISDGQLGSITAETGVKFNFSESGKYQIILKGEVEDESGNKYNFGGNYEVYVGKLLNILPRINSGEIFTVGDKYIPNFEYSPPIKAEVEFSLEIYPFDGSEKKMFKINKEIDGVFSENSIPLSNAGEYKVSARIHARDSLGEDYYASYDDFSFIVPKGTESEAKVTTPPLTLEKFNSISSEFFTENGFKMPHSKGNLNPFDFPELIDN